MFFLQNRQAALAKVSGAISLIESWVQNFFLSDQSGQWPLLTLPEARSSPALVSSSPSCPFLQRNLAVPKNVYTFC